VTTLYQLVFLSGVKLTWDDDCGKWSTGALFPRIITIFV